MQVNQKQLRRFCILFSTLTAGLALSISRLQAQEKYTVEPVGTLLPDIETLFGPAEWFGLVEIPFLCLTVFFSFLTANALRGGLLGRGMNLVAWGFLVMAVGHLHMQVEHFFTIICSLGFLVSPEGLSFGLLPKLLPGDSWGLAFTIFTRPVKWDSHFFKYAATVVSREDVNCN